RYIAPGSAAARRTAAARAAVASAEAAVANPPRYSYDAPASPAPDPEPASEPEAEPSPEAILDSEPGPAPPLSDVDSIPSSETFVTVTPSTSTDTVTGRPHRRPQADPYNIYPGALAASGAGARNPAITREGKWRPIHNWSPLYDLIYAKRCMATLVNGSPRKAPFVIMLGQRWWVDWETGKCARWVPKVEGGEKEAAGPPPYEP
ncbi:hypothetical protein V495_08061, partial [Pseudogymnoascus sp. VKM F-4514 (FW-929)]